MKSPLVQRRPLVFFFFCSFANEHKTLPSIQWHKIISKRRRVLPLQSALGLLVKSVRSVKSLWISRKWLNVGNKMFPLTLIAKHRMIDWCRSASWQHGGHSIIPIPNVSQTINIKPLQINNRVFSRKSIRTLEGYTLQDNPPSFESRLKSEKARLSQGL